MASPDRIGITPLESVLRRDRTIVLSGIMVIAGLAWAYTVYRTQSLSDMDSMGMGMSMPNMQSWGAIDFVTTFAMWAVMMVAMMVPTAAPMILVFAKVNRRRREEQRPFVPTGIFLLGYVLIWSGFAVIATLATWGLHSGGLLSSMMGASNSSILGGILLLAAGVYQLSPLKYVCLTHCRSPLGFIMTGWREGVGGALDMGLRHGLFCLGCCWVLMGLLFVLGVMNLVWIAILAGFVLLEKVGASRPVGESSNRAAVDWMGNVYVRGGTRVIIEAITKVLEHNQVQARLKTPW
jgi:predicted metal-binding membrane protein